eukprot:143749-Amorphochlora_amoeboformis.AAC.1
MIVLGFGALIYNNKPMTRSRPFRTTRKSTHLKRNTKKEAHTIRSLQVEQLNTARGHRPRSSYLRRSLENRRASRRAGGNV